MASRNSDQHGDLRRIVVIGATSRLGGMLRAFWPEAVPVTWQSRQAVEGFTVFDLGEGTDKAADAVRGAEAVICLSGVTPAYAARTGSGMELNVDLAAAAVRIAARAGCGRVLVASSAAVYGNPVGVLHEDTPCNPVSAYGAAKLEMERVALDLGRELGVAVTALRIGNVAGADAILGGWRPGMRIDLLPDGSTPRRSYIGPRTLGLALRALARADDLPGIVNVAAPGTVEMGALLDAAGLDWSPQPAGPGTIACVELDTGRLARVFPFRPEQGDAGGLVREYRAWIGGETT